MAGSTWPTLAAGARAKASEVEAKFDWVEQDIVPMAAGSKADNTYDLGQSSFRWRNVYVGPGSAGTPAVCIRAADMGWYSSAVNTMDLAIAGVNVFTINNSGTHTLSQSITTTMAFNIINGRNDTTTSNAQLLLRTIGDSAGDPYTTYSVQGAHNVSVGIDNNQSNRFAISLNGNMDDSTDAFRISMDGEITKPKQPAFLAQRSNSSPLTGAGSTTTLTFGTEVFDQGSDFSSDTFSAPITGRYLLAANVELLKGTSTAGVFSTSTLNIVTSNRTYQFDDDYAKNLSATNDSYHKTISIIADMDAGDTAQISVSVNAGGGVANSVIIENADFYGCLLA